MLSEINIAPRILTNFTGVMPPQFKKDLDSYLKTRSPVTFLSDLRSNLQVNWFDLSCSLLSLLYKALCVHCLFYVLFLELVFPTWFIHLETWLNLDVECTPVSLVLRKLRQTDHEFVAIPNYSDKTLSQKNTHQNIVIPVHWVSLTGLYFANILSLTQL